MVDDISETCGGSRTRTLNPDLATDLPDFVQDHLSDSNQDSRLHMNNFSFNERNASRSGATSDFAAAYYQPPSHSFPDLTVEDVPNNANLLINDAQNGADEAAQSVDIDDTSNNSESVVLPLSLPDFLSDGPMLNHVPSPDKDEGPELGGGHAKCPHCQAALPDVDNVAELAELRRVNSELIQQLDSSRAIAESATRKVLKLEKEVSVLISKEADEATALEEMVRQVEHNLKLTTVSIALE